MSARKRKLSSLTPSDIGKHITCVTVAGKHIEGTLRAFTHGVFSNPSKGEVDVPRVGINIYALRSHEHHWAKPDTLASLTQTEEDQS